ncbi:MAG: SRPBCC domain-containing protein [SAR324 cluster bacterium]|nr:SRPBCC domain-containing protein [SAR324 cluster bacterium]
MKKSRLIQFFFAFLTSSVLLGCSETIHTSIEIEASSQDTWHILTDFKNYPEWNTFVQKVEGDVSPGSVIQVRVQSGGDEPMDFEPTVLHNDENEILEWEGQFLMPGIFTGRHGFILESMGPGQTLLIHKEDFHGILVPFFDFSGTEEGFKAMNRALKKRVEGI